MEGGDSNAEILPAKRSNKKKRANEVCEDGKVKKNQKLSNSQKRKLKKMEEEKEKEILFSKSIEMLEKYKIPDDAFPLLRSSKSIGRAETLMEKRRMAVQFSKAGFEVPHIDGFFKGRSHCETSCDAETQLDKIQVREDIDENSPVQSLITERNFLNKTPDSLLCPQQLSHSYEFCSDGGSNASLCAEKGSAKVNGVAIQEGISNSTMKISGDDDRKISNPMDAVHGGQNKDTSRNADLADCSLHRPITAPTIIHVLRPDEVENKRKDLPIVMMEQEIMEAINDHSSIIICGETGCGKTTQVPQFLYEAGFGSKQFSARSGIIGVTQPRRVAVLATAKRVAFELGLHLGKEIGFQVRYDKQIGERCSIKFMTDGILLREVQNDMLLRRYSVIILDEAHERSLNTDILIGMVSRVIQARQHFYEEQRKMVLSGQSISSENTIYPIKLVLMSATLRVEDFISGRRLFREPPPVIEVPTRQFPVTVHFSKRTEVVDYIGQAYKKVISIHRRLPQGGILVFLTGQREVEHLCQKLRKASRELNSNTSQEYVRNDVTGISEISSIEGMNMKEINEAFDVNRNSTHQQTDRFSSYEDDFCDIQEDDESDYSYNSETDSDLEIINEDWNSSEQKICDNSDSLVGVLGDNGSLASLKAAFEALSDKNGFDSNPGSKQSVSVAIEESLGQTNLRMEKREEEDKGLCAGALHVLPLYAMLPANAQLHVFEEVKEGERLVVVATNVAETSLTIPGIKYVVDTGREKVKSYNPASGMETYEIQWISKASAAQRAGRAGRTGPGHCYRLYSSPVFNNIFPDFSCAEISKVPVAGVILLLKSMRISKVANFPFPTPPETTSLFEAECCLKTLEALDCNGNLTSLGRAMAYFPMSPRHSRMLLTVIQLMRKVRNYERANIVLGYAVATAAALSLSYPFIMQFGGSSANKKGLDHNEKYDASEGEGIVHKQEKLRKKKLKEAAKESHARFSNPRSDALTVAYALQCFELSTSPGDFCNENALHLKTMEEMSKLRKQLLQLVFHQNVNSEVGQDFSWIHGTMEDVEHSWRIGSSKCPLLHNEEELLGHAVCAGWVDRVAKRIRGISGSSEGDRKANAVRYKACMVKETVFLHRWSSVSRSAPEFLVYSELLHTKRPYMHGATSVKSDWLVKYAGSLCSFSAPLTDPKPYYDPQADQVFCWVIPTFGPHLWELPLHTVPIANDVHRIAVFAYSLLEGNVLPCIRSVRQFMTAPPGTILRPEASGQKRVGNFLYKLKTRSIDSCRMLRKAWDENPKFLQPELLDWFHESFHNQFEELWSKMLYEVCLEPQEHFPKRMKKDRKKSKLLI